MLAVRSNIAPAFASTLAALVLSACGDSTERRVQSTDSFDTSFSEVSFDTSDAREVNTPPDFGDPCNGNIDCVTGHCVEGPSGFVCSMSCQLECPSGWACLGVQSGSSDITYVCVPEGGPQPDATITPDSTDTSDTGTQPDINDTSVTTDTGTPADTTTDTGGPSDTVGPADTTDTTTTDTVADVSDVSDTGPQPPLGNACDAPPGVGSDNLLTESQVNGQEWPDCIGGDCFEVNPDVWVVDLRSMAWTGAMGGFDDGDHTYEFTGGTKVGPDIDIVAVKAPPRTMLEFAVVRDSSSSLSDPLVYVHDGFAIRTYNADVSGTNSCARTTIGSPYISGLPVYVVIEETANYELWSPTGYGAGTVGGSNYGWILRIRTAPWVPIDMGNLLVNQVGTITNDSLSVGGETRYYRFYAPGTAKPRVTITRTGGGAAFDPAVAGMKTIQGELVWQRAELDGDQNGTVILQSTGMRPCIPQSECPSGFPCPPDVCTAANVEWVFAVYDYNGAGGAGTFRYDVRVEVQP